MPNASHAQSPGPADRCARTDPRVRRSREELRDLVLDAGREVLLSEGLGTGAEHLSFKRVLSHLAAARGIRVTNASVIGRIWENQEEFQLDVVSSVAGIQGDEEVAVTLDAFLPVLGLIDTSTPERRRASLAELIRVSCDRYISAASTSLNAIQMALITYVAASKSSGADNPLIESFRVINRRLTERYAEMYSIGLQACGWRVREPFTMYDVATLVSAVAEGILMHRLVDPGSFRPVVRPSPVAEGDVEWNQLGVTMDALVDVCCEPDPHWVG